MRGRGGAPIAKPLSSARLAVKLHRASSVKCAIHSPLPIVESPCPLWSSIPAHSETGRPQTLSVDGPCFVSLDWSSAFAFPPSPTSF